MRRNGELLKQEPRIKLSTIHGMKGGECDNVVLLSDLQKIQCVTLKKLRR